jgi:hypothetical protein
MAESTIILLGGPDSGKTNYLARLWEAMRAGNGALIAPNIPTDIKYVEDALTHLLQGHFAPRSDKNVDDIGQSIRVPVIGQGEAGSANSEIVVPDVSGELWSSAVENRELPERWMSLLKESAGAILFVRVGSDQNIAPLDWVTSAQLLRMPALAPGNNSPEHRTPTQVALCELLSFLKATFSNKWGRPRVAVVVTAWDRVDAVTAAEGPGAYLAREFPLLSGKSRNLQGLEVKVFGVSIVGGDFVDPVFKQAFFNQDLKDSGYVVVEKDDGTTEKKPDLTLPVAWVARKSG